MLRLLTTCLIAISLQASPLFAAEEAPVFKIKPGSHRIGDLISLEVELKGSGFQLGAMDEEDLAPFEPAGSHTSYNAETGISTLTVKGHIFKTGELTIPPLTILNKDGSSVKSAELKIVIEPLLKGDEKDIRAMKPQAAVDENGPLWPWLLTALIIALVLALIIYLKRLKGIKGEEEEVAAIAIPPHVEALERLEKIEAMHLIREGRIKEFYTLVSDVIRLFEGKSHGFDAMEMTTEELGRHIRAKTASAAKLAGLNASENASEEEREFLAVERFLRDCDMVKFAKYRPADMDISALCERAREIIRARQLIKEKNSIPEEESGNADGQEVPGLLSPTGRPEEEKEAGEKADAV